MKRAMRIGTSLAINLLGLGLAASSIFVFFTSIFPMISHKATSVGGVFGVIFGGFAIAFLSQMLIANLFAKIAFKLTGELPGFMGFYNRLNWLVIKVLTFGLLDFGRRAHQKLTKRQ